MWDTKHNMPNTKYRCEIQITPAFPMISHSYCIQNFCIVCWKFERMWIFWSWIYFMNLSSRGRTGSTSSWRNPSWQLWALIHVANAKNFAQSQFLKPKFLPSLNKDICCILYSVCSILYTYVQLCHHPLELNVFYGFQKLSGQYAEEVWVSIKGNPNLQYQECPNNLQESSYVKPRDER